MKPFARVWSFAVAALAALSVSACGGENAAEAEFQARAKGETRPNVLIFLVDDLGLAAGAYGDEAAVTPTIDRLAREGTVFDAAYAASGSPLAAEAGFLTGVHPQVLGAVQEWSGQPAYAVVPPPEVKAFPELLRERGWHTFRVGGGDDPFGSPASLWDEDRRDAGAILPTGDVRQPFLGLVRLDGGAETPDRPSPVDAARIKVPAWLPDTPEVRAALKARYDRLHRADAQIASVLMRLEAQGALSHTVVVVTSATGPDLPGARRTLYEPGVRVPLIVRRPDKAQAGVRRADLFGGVDFAPSILGLAGVEPRAWMQGRDRFGGARDPGPRHLFSIQTRLDDAEERTRAVRDGRFLYVRADELSTPLAALAPKGALLDTLTELNRQGALPPAAARLFSAERPDEELYDLRADPDQLRNLAEDPARTADLERLSAVMDSFQQAAPDLSLLTPKELADRFAPGGAAPVTARPTGKIEDGVLTLETLTTGASVLWRPDDRSPWRLYTGPATLPEKARPEAKAVRYGFKESGAVRIER